jgi:hypothetical protein
LYSLLSGGWRRPLMLLVRPVIPMTRRIEFKAPWAAVTPEEQERLEAELAREVCLLHHLASLDREVVARRTDTNDILVAINPHLCECAQVRLTWSGKTEMNPEVPKMELEATFQDWIEDKMLPDHAAHRMGPNE